MIGCGVTNNDTLTTCGVQSIYALKNQDFKRNVLKANANFTFHF